MGIRSFLRGLLEQDRHTDAQAPEELFPQPDPLEVEGTFEPEFRACRDLLALAWER